MAENQIVDALHHPYNLKPMVWLDCSCGFSGPTTVNFDDQDEVGKCPNCGSQTVHPNHVTDKPTTIHTFDDGTKETVIAKDPEVKSPATPVSAAPSVDDVTKQVMKNLQPLFDRLNTFMDAQTPKKEGN